MTTTSTNQSPEILPRHLSQSVLEAMQDTPAVLINGPRQSGKTTLAKQCAPNLPYYTLDDPTLLNAVRADPLGFVQQLDRAIIDEVQRAPELLLALKLSVDQNRRPGRFLLTGSANLMALPQVSESLAGRIEILTLLPLSQAELNQRPSQFLKCALTQTWPLQVSSAVNSELTAQVLTGGFPEMQQRSEASRRQAWARAYTTTLVERDIRDLAQLEQIRQVPQLLAIAAELSGQLLNLTQIGGQIGLDAKTVAKYLDLLERLFLVRRLPAWSRNHLKRLTKTPKLHFIDSGLQSTLTGLTADAVFMDRSRFGATLETWVYGELLKILSLTPEPWFLSHYRDNLKHEVDFVLESPSQQVLGIEVKAAASVQAQDFKNLRVLREHCGKQFVSGIVLYNGSHAISFGEQFWAIPLQML
jgi:predicted AAA+ superfamily ATPase